MVSYQERSIGIIAEMRKLATENSKEIRDAVEDGKKRMAHLIEQGAAVALIAKSLMSDTTVPVRAGVTTPALPEEPRKLDDVMLAMDVVDTLRHRTRIVDMELNESARERSS